MSRRLTDRETTVLPNSKRLKSRHFLKSSLRCIELHAMVATVLCPISVSPQHKTQSSHTTRYNYSYCDIRKLKVIQSPKRSRAMRCDSTIVLCMTISLEPGRMHSSPSSSRRVIKPQLCHTGIPEENASCRRRVLHSTTITAHRAAATGRRGSRAARHPDRQSQQPSGCRSGPAC